MSEQLKDLRAKITPETDAVLEAMNRACGKDKSEIVRDVLHAWASQKIHESSLVDRLLKAEGLPGIAAGSSGKPGA
jgi:hypothetical protein